MTLPPSPDDHPAKPERPAADLLCHCEAVGRGNLQHRSVMTDAPINIEHFGFTMLIGWQPDCTAVLEIPTGFALGMTEVDEGCFY